MAKKKDFPKDAAVEIRELRQRIRAPILGRLQFTKRGVSAEGVYVRFPVRPQVGEKLSIDQYSIKRLNHELHVTEWVVAEISHELNLEPMPASDDGDGVEPSLPEAALVVTVRPAR